MSLEALHQFHRGETLLRRVVPQHTEIDARFDAHLLTGLCYRLIHDLDDILRRQSPVGVQIGEKQDLGIEHLVPLELFKDIEGDKA